MSVVSSSKPLSRNQVAAQLAALSALGPFSIDAYLPAMPDIASFMGVSLTAMQATLTAYLFPFALMTLWHGALSDALGRKRVVIGGLCLFLLGSLGCALSHSLTMLLIFRCIQGSTAGVGMVVGRAIVRDLYEGADAQKLMALVAIVFAIAPAIAPLIGGWLHHWFGWQAVFYFIILYTAALIYGIHHTLPETLPVSKRQSFHPGFLAKSYLSAVRNPVFVNACLTITLAFAGLFLYVVSAPAFIINHLHRSETEFYWLFGPLTLGIVLGNGLSGRLAGRLPLERTATIGCVVMAACALANVAMNLLMAPALPWAVLPLFGYMVGMSLTMPTMTIRAIDCFPNQRGLAASCQSFIQSSGSSLLSACAPLLWATSLSLALSQLCFALIACSLLALLIFWTTRRVGVSGGAEAVKKA